MPNILIPKVLIKYTNGVSNFILDFAQLNELDACLQKNHPDLYQILYNEAHQLKNFVCVYLNSKLIRDHGKSNICVNHQDTIEIVVAIAGG